MLIENNQECIYMTKNETTDHNNICMHLAQKRNNDL
jgi:hypothetical protein